LTRGIHMFGCRRTTNSTPHTNRKIHRHHPQSRGRGNTRSKWRWICALATVDLGAIFRSRQPHAAGSRPAGSAPGSGRSWGRRNPPLPLPLPPPPPTLPVRWFGGRSRGGEAKGSDEASGTAGWGNRSLTRRGAGSLSFGDRPLESATTQGGVIGCLTGSEEVLEDTAGGGGQRGR